MIHAGYTPAIRERLTDRLACAGLPVEPATAIALTRFLKELSRWNRVHDLTAITEPEAMIRRHVVESPALRDFLRGDRAADVGRGAGVPGIPPAIAEPQRRFTLIESRGKRAAFLRHVQGRPGLANVAVEHRRVEDMNDAGPSDTRSPLTSPHMRAPGERQAGPRGANAPRFAAAPRAAPSRRRRARRAAPSPPPRAAPRPPG